ncbi:heterokaryon incompatibility protein-domain-containing protein [Annulohypoxylon nitens]|nr:heterokaryon incompatibility protein-domain-containing protein [Annulohypoxylon nitens]
MQLKDTYLALSYVWGVVPNTLQTTMSNRDELSKYGALDIEEYKDRIPQVIKDAMKFTLDFGQRYLWVDALCIVQGDNEFIKDNIRNMNLIYQRAYLTLVAWTATASTTPLAGVEGDLRPQVMRRRIQHKLLESRLSEDVPLLSQYHEISHYGTRAWTYQERLLPPICLFFHHREPLLFLNDGKVMGTQSLGAQKDDKFNALALQGENQGPERMYREMGAMSQAPQLASYIRQVEHYTGLNMERLEDKLNAFYGILEILKDATGPLSYGIPIRTSPLSLLWTASGLDANLIRNEGFPSWSWAGWTGRVFFPDCFTQDFNVDLESIDASETVESGREHLWSSTNFDRCPGCGIALVLGDENFTERFLEGIEEKNCKVLHFEAETVELDEEWLEGKHQFYHIRGKVPVDDLKSKRSKCGFVRIATSGDGERKRIETMLVEWKDTYSGVAERVLVCRFKEEDWIEREPKLKEIHLV